jgi:hypothetical protein
MLGQYRRFIAEVDRLVTELAHRYGAQLRCRPGCHSCCRHDLSVFVVETASVQRAFLELPDPLRGRITRQAERVTERRAEGKQVDCPFLVRDCCAIYPLRPLICRTQGLPLLVTIDDGRQAVDFCPVNFSEPGEVGTLDLEHLLPLDLINLKLAAANLKYCRAAGIGFSQSGRRTSMSEIVLAQPGAMDYLQSGLIG